MAGFEAERYREMSREIPGTGAGRTGNGGGFYRDSRRKYPRNLLVFLTISDRNS